MGFKKVLIANRGEIALRIMRTLRDMGIEAAIIYGKEDRLSLPVQLADDATFRDVINPLDAYLDIEAVVQAAKDMGCDAVHPGYGFLAENAGFVKRLEEEGITFIGPSADVITLLGDKIEARAAMEAAGLPTAKGSSEPISEASVASALADDIGYPVIIKAAAGGGGIGMQIVEQESEFESALKLCQSRAKSAFGDDRVFVEKYIQGAQHVEFQVLADGKDAIHFGERFCSIQRRHQKLVEEGPWLTPEKRHEIGSLVCKGAESVGYKGLATFEFLRDANGDFYFLEVNPRVQVEHTVTELITGHNLVELGVRVAQEKHFHSSRRKLRGEVTASNADSMRKILLNLSQVLVVSGNAISPQDSVSVLTHTPIQGTRCLVVSIHCSRNFSCGGVTERMLFDECEQPWMKPLSLALNI